MMNYLVIGICILLLVLVIYISAKPISMGIEARRNINDNKTEISEEDGNPDGLNIDNPKKINITDEIIKLKDLKEKGVITKEEFDKAKKKILS